MASEKAVRVNLRKRLMELYKLSSDLINDIFRIHRDLTKIYKDKRLAPLTLVTSAPFKTKLQKSTWTYKVFVIKLGTLELETAMLREGGLFEVGLEEGLTRSHLMQACREQREKAVGLERRIKEVEDLIEAVMRPKHLR